MELSSPTSRVFDRIAEMERSFFVFSPGSIKLKIMTRLERPTLRDVFTPQKFGVAAVRVIVRAAY